MKIVPSPNGFMCHTKTYAHNIKREQVHQKLYTFNLPLQALVQALWPWYSSGLDDERETIENQVLITDGETVEDNEGEMEEI